MPPPARSTVRGFSPLALTSVVPLTCVGNGTVRGDRASKSRALSLVGSAVAAAAASYAPKLGWLSSLPMAAASQLRTSGRPFLARVRVSPTPRVGTSAGQAMA